ncbi:ParB/RepB/Spo0J family partition protein [Pseudoduganella sp. RAF19]|uniref:ParB/RepB/Spo0J family partition protein n=1 Tax=Pseudoduganella sp. RAF19 TaxID=3233052 RepID=UPI003F969FF5
MSKLVALAPPVVPMPADRVIVVDELVIEGHQEVDTWDIRISLTNRKRFNEEALQRLAENVNQYGILQHLLIRPVKPTADQPQRFEIVAGERRYRAAVIAGLSRVPVRVKALSDEQAAVIQLLENIQREDPHPLEEAEGYQGLMHNHGYTIDQLIEHTKKSRTYIYNRLKLCRLSLKLRDMFLDDKFEESVAEQLARLPTPAMQLKAAEEVSKPDYYGNRMSVRAVREHLRTNYTVELKGAVFSIKDSNLVNIAGSCVECPKRSGNQPDFDGGDKNANVCTDPSCFREKEAAHAANARKKAEDAGKTVVTGDAAKKIKTSSWNDSLSAGYSALDAKFYVGGKETTYRKLLGKNLPETVLVEDPNKPGKLIEAAKTKDLEERAQESDAAGKTPAAEAAKAKAKEKQQERDAAIERQYRRDLFTALRGHYQEHGPAPYDKHEIAVLLFSGCPNEADGFIRKTYGWTGSEFESGYFNKKWVNGSDKIKDVIRQMPIDDVHQLIIDLTFARDLIVNTYSGHGEKPTRMLKAAVEAGIDAPAIRAGLVQAAKEKEAAKSKPKAKKTKAKAPAQKEINLAPAAPAAKRAKAKPKNEPAPAASSSTQEGAEELVGIDLTTLQTEDALTAYIKANPGRLDDLADLIIDQAPHLVATLEAAGDRAGYMYRGGWHIKPIEATALQAEDTSAPETAESEAQEPAGNRKTLSLKPKAVAGEDAASDASGPTIKVRKNRAAQIATDLRPAAAWPFPTPNRP